MNLDELEPIPGDYVMALNVMRAWTSDETRGNGDVHIMKGEQALVVETWSVGNQRRVRVLRDNRIMLFSCGERIVRRNWKVARPAPRLPTFGCP